MSASGVVTSYTLSGSVSWTVSIGPVAPAVNPVIDGDGNIFIGSEDFTMYAISPSGSILWKYETYDKITGSAAVDASTTVWFGSNDFSVYALSLLPSASPSPTPSPNPNECKQAQLNEYDAGCTGQPVSAS